MAAHRPRRKKDGDTFTYWELFEEAAKRRYGQNIRVIKNDFYEKKVNNIDFQLKIINMDKKPRETTRTIVDINMKEFTNHGKVAKDHESDESVVQIQKKSTTTDTERFTFSTTKGVTFGVGGNIGAQIMGAAVAGGSIGLNAKYEKTTTKTEETETKKEKGSEYCYNQEEKIIVPPGTRVEATITTYRMKYEKNYSVKFSIDKNASIPVVYRTQFQNMLGGVCRNSGIVNVRDMISTLPDYNAEDDDDTVSFTQAGTLSWVGEGCSVEKIEKPLTL